MKTLLLSMISLCLFASAYSQQGVNRQASSPKKVAPRPQLKTQKQYLADAKAFYSLSLCNAAKASYSFLGVDYQDQDLIKNINECLSSKASLDEAEDFNPAEDELYTLSIPANQQVGYENVEFGNLEFAAQRYRNALHFYLLYLVDNYTMLRKDRDLLNKFEEKIEYCLRKSGY
jgi:hypothetical protein